MPETTPKMGLAAWDQPLDIYNYQQFANNWNIVDFHDHTPGRGVQIPYGGLAAGSVGLVNLAADAAAKVTGKVSNVATSQSVTSTSYTTLGTPDRVSNVVVGTNSLLEIWYQAMWQSSVTAAAKAAIFIGSNQLQAIVNSTSTAPAVQEATIGSTINVNQVLATYPAGLLPGAQTSNYTGDVTTGQVVGAYGVNSGWCSVFVAAGTYTVSVQFKSSSGSVTASNRKLWVRVSDFQ